MITKVVRTITGLWVPYRTEGSTVHIWSHGYYDQADAELAVGAAWFDCAPIEGGVPIDGEVRRQVIFAAIAKVPAT